MQIKNINLKDYLCLYGEELYEYDWVIEYSEQFNTPVNQFGVDLMKCTFGFVKDLQYYLSNGLTWQQLIEMVSEEIKVALLDYDILKVFQFRKYLIAEVEKIIEIEGIALDSGYSQDDERAGIERLAPFGVYAQIRQYAITFNQTIAWARAQTYEDAFTELAYQAAIDSYQKNLLKIRHLST